MKIGKKEISSKSVYFIAEAGVNHEGNQNLARALVYTAAWAGVDAVKVQTFKTELIVTKSAQKASYQQENLKNKDSQFEMLKKLELDDAGHKLVQKLCHENGIEFLSTPHSGIWSVDYLESLGVSAYKIGSGDLTNIPILRYIAKKGKPIILSTGMANLDEVTEAVQSIKQEGNNDIIVLHCTTDYPCKYSEVNLNAMLTIKEKLDIEIGYSDHTPGIIVPIMATALGATIIEKHYTLDKTLKGNSPDHVASLSPQELKEAIQAIKWTKESRITNPIEAVKQYYNYINEAPPVSEATLKEILGNGEKIPFPSELEIAKVARKSIIATKHINQGKLITIEAVDIRRPEKGLRPRYLEELISGNYVATQNINIDEPITKNNTNFNH